MTMDAMVRGIALHLQYSLYGLVYNGMIYLSIESCIIVLLSMLLSLISFDQELQMVIWFTAEFLVRVWSAGCRSRYQQVHGRLQFIRRPLCIVGESPDARQCHPFSHSFIHSFVHSFIDSFVCACHSLVHWFTDWFLSVLVHWFIDWFIR